MSKFLAKLTLATAIAYFLIHKYSVKMNEKQQIAQAVDNLGYAGCFTPLVSTNCPLPFSG